MIAKLIEKYNNLDGKTVTRKELTDYYLSLFDYLPESEIITIIRSKIDKLLDSDTTSKSFKITISEKYNKETAKGLNAPRHKGNAKTALTECGRLKKGYKYVKGGKIVKLPRNKKGEYVWFSNKEHKLFSKRGQIQSITNNKNEYVYSIKLEDNSIVKAKEKEFVGFNKLPKTFKFQEKKPTESKNFKFSFTKPFSENAIFQHVTKGWNANKLTDKELSKSYAYGLLAMYLQSNRLRLDLNIKNNVLFNQNASKDLAKKLKNEVKKRKLNIDVDIDMNAFIEKNKAKKDTKKKEVVKVFNKKPKSVSIKQAIKDVLPLEDKNLTEISANTIFRLFKDKQPDKDGNIEVLVESKFNYSILDSKGAYKYVDVDFTNDFDEVSGNEFKLTEKGVAFVKRVKNRLESLKNQKYNYSLFDGLNGVNENIDTSVFKKMTVSELRVFTLDYYKKFLSGKNIDIEKHISNIQFTNRNGRKLAKGGAMYASKAAVVEKLESLIKNSTYNNWGDRKSTDHKDILGFLNFKSKLTINGTKRHIRISIEIWKDGNKVFKNYDVGLNKKSSVSKGFSPLDEETELGYKDTKNNLTTKNQGLKAEIKEVFLPAPEPQEVFLNVPTVVREISVNYTKDSPGLNAIDTVEEKPVINRVEEKPIVAIARNNKNPFKSTAEKAKAVKVPANLYKLKNHSLSKLLGRIEIKPKQSLVITLDSKAGGGKTHTCYQMAQAFAESGYSPILWSLEEHEESNLAEEKKTKYFNDVTKQIISVESENNTLSDIDNYNKILESIKYFDVILIDSLTKLIELNKKFKLDKDFRKAFDGKLFILIVQRTSDGKMRGGSSTGFDGDIILKVDVNEDGDFRKNFIYNDKNRYNDFAPLSDLKYSPFHQELLQDEPKEVFLNVKA